jgi:ribosomal protein S18 acetylase RimI-like enzyme
MGASLGGRILSSEVFLNDEAPLLRKTRHDPHRAAEAQALSGRSGANVRFRPVVDFAADIRMHIRPATAADFDAMWSLFQAVIAKADALPFSQSFEREIFRSHWFTTQTSHVAVADSLIVGMYKMGANYPDLGSHVSSATYIVDPAAQGRGIGRALVEHSLAQARSAGFLAMQFNYVVSTNAPAVALYRNLGFDIVGTLPKAFQHRNLGLVDVYVMHRFL